MHFPPNVPILLIYPGESKIIQFLQVNAQKEQVPYVIPGGTTLQGSLVDELGCKVATLQPTITDATRGLVTVTLEDTTLVRANRDRKCLFNVRLSSTVFRNLGALPLVIQDDLMDAPMATLSPAITPGGSTPGSPVTPNVPSSGTGFRLYEGWAVDGSSKKYDVAVSIGTDGKPLWKFTELLNP